MSVQTFSLFVSSPGDVAVERRRVAAIVSRLNGECAGRARIDTIRWETEFYRAHATFQSQIVQAADCDIVLTIFKWRLGTELPPDFPERLPSGEPYPSGTAYELLTSMERRRGGAATPDVFVYRYSGSSPRPAIDDPDRDRIGREWDRLNRFFERWFVTPEGHFLAAFQTYASEDDLETQVEALLRKWLTDKIAAGRILPWPDALKGSPFPGLEAYGRRHAVVFFGRERDTTRAVELWQEAAHRGTAFLLIVGGSGAGKSSLARAGLVPRITTPGVVEEVDGWRIAVFRPGDSPAGPLAALAEALLVRERDLPPSEEGRGAALPEIVDETVPDASALASLLGTDPEAGAALAVAALDRIGAAIRDSERHGRVVRIDLVLVVDQLDELFGTAMVADTRDRFVAALSRLVATGRVWVAATLRADLYGAMLDQPGLKGMKEAGATYDLAPPGPAELAAIVRRPAEAADLHFGTDPASGVGVDERLLREADRPDMLPLVQLALARLYEGRRTENGRTVLPFDVFAGLGGLTGIIDEVGERALTGLDPAAIRALPRLVRGLAQLETEGALSGTLTVTPVRLAEAAPDGPRRQLVDALVSARLLTLTDAGDGTLVRLAHQRVLTDWARTREIVAGSADFYRIRADIDRRRTRWEANRRPDLLLSRGLPLAEAENIVARFGDEIAPETRAFVRASRVRAGRAQMLTATAAVVFAIVAVVAVFQWGVAREQTRLAERNFGVAKRTVQGLVFNIVQGLRNVAGMRVDALRRILETVQQPSELLAAAAPEDPEVLRIRGGMFHGFAETYLTAGDVAGARDSARKAVEVYQLLTELRPDEPRVRSDLSVPTSVLGVASLRGGDLSEATRLIERALELARASAARSPDDPLFRQRVHVALSRLAEMRLAAGDEAAAVALYRELLSGTRREVAADPASAERRRELVLHLGDIASVELERGNLDEARRQLAEAVTISRTLAADFPADGSMRGVLGAALQNLADYHLRAREHGQALALIDEALAVMRSLAGEDTDNTDRQRNVAVALERRGNALLAAEGIPAALAAYGEQLAIFRSLAARDPASAANQRSVSIALELIAYGREKAGDAAGVLAARRESLGLRRDLVKRQPGSAEAKRDLSIILRDYAETVGAAGGRDEALSSFREAVAISRELAGIDPHYVRPFKDLLDILSNLAAYQERLELWPDASVTHDEEVAVLDRLIALRPGDKVWREWLGRSLLSAGTQRLFADDDPGALTRLARAVDAYRELVRIDPGRRSTSRLAAAARIRGKVAALAGRKDIAVASLGEAVLLRRELGKDGDAGDRIELAGSLSDLAEVVDDPGPLLREAAGILDEVPEADRTDAARALRSGITERLRAPSPIAGQENGVPRPPGPR